jgi:hypothetical protein
VTRVYLRLFSTAVHGPPSVAFVPLKNGSVQFLAFSATAFCLTLAVVTSSKPDVYVIVDDPLFNSVAGDRSSSRSLSLVDLSSALQPRP